MIKYLFAKIASKNGLPIGASPVRLAGVASTATLGLILWIGASGCETTQPQSASPPVAAPSTNTGSDSLVAYLRNVETPSTPSAASAASTATTGATASLAATGTAAPAAATAGSASLLLHEGDVLQIKFPGAPEMDALQTIRSDGKITISMVGDIKVSGLTPDLARQALLDACGPQLKVKEVTVSVQSSAFIFYVTGSVLRPGKLIEDRPVTPLEAVIEAGIDPTKSNLAKVKVIRTDENGHTTTKILNLQKIIDKGRTEPFTLKPYDIIYVPEKFSMF
jgi:polysaccharide export outer membrane protein